MMGVRGGMLGLCCWLALLGAGVSCRAQDGVGATADGVQAQGGGVQEHAGGVLGQEGNVRPLPDIPALMRAVEARQRTAEEARKDYIFHSVVTQTEVDGHGAAKKTEVKEYDDFWINGVPVEKLVKKDGRELTADEAKKESERVDQEAAKAKERRAKEDAKGKETDPRGHDEVTVSRLLELGSFANARRVELNGRQTIAVDYQGDPQAKTKNRAESVIRDMAGTVWVDEDDEAIARIEGRFVSSFKIGGGLVANIREGTNFSLQMTKVHGEVWLPARVEGKGEARMLLFFKFNGSLTAVYSDYRKFKTSSAIVGVGVVKE